MLDKWNHMYVSYRNWLPLNTFLWRLMQVVDVSIINSFPAK